MRKAATVLATAAALVLIGITSPSPADARGGFWRGGFGPGLAGGLIAGAIIGGLASSAYAGPGYGYYPGYAYYGGYGPWHSPGCPQPGYGAYYNCCRYAVPGYGAPVYYGDPYGAW